MRRLRLDGTPITALTRRRPPGSSRHRRHRHPQRYSRTQRKTREMFLFQSCDILSIQIFESCRENPFAKPSTQCKSPPPAVPPNCRIAHRKAERMPKVRRKRQMTHSPKPSLSAERIDLCQNRCYNIIIVFKYSLCVSALNLFSNPFPTTILVNPSGLSLTLSAFQGTEKWPPLPGVD